MTESKQERFIRLDEPNRAKTREYLPKNEKWNIP